MRDIITAAITSFLIYDEDNFIDKLKCFFPKMHVHIKPVETKTDFFSVVEVEKDVFVNVARGTDGTNIRKKIAAWKRNFNFNPGPNGIHDGFENSANGNFLSTRVAMRIQQDKKWIFTGHSAAAASQPVNAYFTARSNMLKPKVIVFSVPPPGDCRFKKAFDGMRIDCSSNTAYGDPILKYFRDGKGKLRSGVDVGKKNVFPKNKWWESIPFIRTISHSPRYLCNLLINYEAKDIEEIKILKKLKRMCVN